MDKVGIFGKIKLGFNFKLSREVEENYTLVNISIALANKMFFKYFNSLKAEYVKKTGEPLLKGTLLKIIYKI